MCIRDSFYVSKKQILMWYRDINDIYQAALENTYRKDNTLVTPILNFFPEESVYIAQNGMDAMLIEKEMIVLANKSLFFWRSDAVKYTCTEKTGRPA